MIMTIIGAYLVITFVMMRFSFSIATKLITIGAIGGIMLLLPSFKTEISTVIMIIVLAYVIKRCFMQR